MLRRTTFIAILCLIASGCGISGSSDYPDDVPTQLPPTVSRIDPAAGPAGTAITIFGFGFSEAAPNNTVIIGNTAVSATAYTLLPAPTATEIESLTATVPADAAAGANPVTVVVGENASNSDITFTVTP